MSTRQPSRRGHWLTWLSGFVLLSAVIYQNVIGQSTQWIDPSGQSAIGWPVIFLGQPRESNTIQFGPLLLDLVVGALLVGGALTTIERFCRDRINVPTMDLKTFGVISTTILGWSLLAGLLHVPFFIFLGRASLCVIYLAIPCVAYTVVDAVSRIRSFRFQFSIKTMLLALTSICAVAACIVWLRPVRRPPPTIEFVANKSNFGVVQEIEIHSERGITWDYKVINRTHTIPCTLGTNFGIEYTVSAKPVGENKQIPLTITVVKVWHYPRELINPRTGIAESRSEMNEFIRLGENDVMVYRLGYEHLLVPGEWKFEVWYVDRDQPQELGKKLLLEHVFLLQTKR